jgi:ketosteroid isomerase-like protein
MDFTTFMQKREQAALAYCQGDASPINSLATGSDPASFFGPDGHVLQGPDTIKSAYAKGAALFGPKGISRLEILQCEAEADIGYWCGLQHAEVRMDGKPVPMTLRITELFRRENDEWKLVHRHADMLKPAH